MLSTTITVAFARFITIPICFHRIVLVVLGVIPVVFLCIRIMSSSNRKLLINYVSIPMSLFSQFMILNIQCCCEQLGRDGVALSYSSIDDDPDFLTVIVSFVISMHTPSIHFSCNDVVLLAFAAPAAHWDWPCKDNDEEVGLH